MNVIIKNSKFSHNSSPLSAGISVTYYAGYQNFALLNCTFDNNVGSTNLVSISYTLSITDSLITGPTSKSAILADSIFYNNYIGQSLIYLKSLPNLQLQNLTLLNNSDQNSLNFNSATIDKIIEHPKTYMTNQLTTSLLPCKNLLVVDTAQNFLFKDSRLIYNNCKSGNPGINAIYLYKTITFQNNEFIDNQSTVSPLALDISYSDYFTMESLKFDNNTAPEVGDYSVISLSHPNSKQGFKLSNCKFYNNVLAISASDLLNLELNNVTVSGSQNSLYSALLFKITISETSRVAFDTLTLSNNQPLDSAVRFYSDMSNSILDLQIFNSEFMGNSYSKFLLRIDGPLSLSNTSFISDSRFNDNNLSVFSLSFQKGTLSIFNSSFERNFADFDTIVSGSYSFPAVLLIENSNFSSNLGTNIISLSSNTRSNLYTKDCYFYDNQNTTISLRQGS